MSTRGSMCHGSSALFNVQSSAGMSHVQSTGRFTDSIFCLLMTGSWAPHFVELSQESPGRELSGAVRYTTLQSFMNADFSQQRF